MVSNPSIERVFVMAYQNGDEKRISLSGLWREDDRGNRIFESITELDQKSTLKEVHDELSARYSSKMVIFLMKDFLLQTSSDENQRYGLEYLYINGLYQDVEKLISINESSSNPLNKHWAYVYKVMLYRLKEKPSAYEFLKQVQNIRTLEEPLLCLKAFMVLYGYYDLYQFDKFKGKIDQINRLLERYELPFLKQYFQIRLDEVLYWHHWKRNNVIKAREHGFQLINEIQNPYKICMLHNALAHTYVFESYEQSMFLVQQSLNIAEEHQYKDHLRSLTQNTIPFISAVNEQVDEIESNVVSEQAHLAAARGDNETAIRILEKLDNLSPFQQCYLGKAKKDLHLLQRSYDRFIHEQHDYFFAQLPVLEMNRIFAIRDCK